MTIRDATVWNEYSAIALAVRRVYELPAVPTLDWCERTALAMTGLAEHAVARVWHVVATNTGVVLDAEDVGAIDARGVNPKPVHPSTATGAWGSLSWWIAAGDAPARCRATRIEDAIWGPSRDGTTDSWWRSLGLEPSVVGLAPIEPMAFGRHLGVELAWTGASSQSVERCTARMEPVLRELSRRAFLAFGAEPGGSANRVTDREREVLDMLALGYSVREIADVISRSPHTVHDHVKSLHRKLRVSSRGELIARSMGHLGATTAHAPRADAPVPAAQP